MGATGSMQLEELNMALDASDVDTPRGVSAKEEVKRLRTLIVHKSAETLEALAKAKFTEMDVDQNGFLENKELKSVVEWVLTCYTDKVGDEEEFKVKMMERLDANKDGKLDIVEFETLFKEMINRMLLMQRAKAKFLEFDTNKNGRIEGNEILDVVKWTMQVYPGDDQFAMPDKLISMFDANKDNSLDLKEFSDVFEKMLIRLELIEKARAKFRELDSNSSGTLEANEIDTLVSWVLESDHLTTVKDKTSFKQQIMGTFDSNGDGMIDLPEFTNLFTSTLIET